MPDSPADRLRRIADRAAGTAETAGASSSRSARLDSIPDADLARLARDRAAPAESRKAALAEYVARNRAEPTAGDLLLTLIDDPDESVALDAIALAPPFDSRVLGRLRPLLADPRPAFRAAASRELARRKDRAILPTLGAWFRGDDPGFRKSALDALEWVLYPPEWLAFLDGAIRAGLRDEAEARRFDELIETAGRRVAPSILRDLADSGGPLAGRAETILVRQAEEGKLI